MVESDINDWMICWSKGRASLSALFEKNVYSTNETIRVLCSIDNSNFRAFVLRLKMDIIQCVNLYSNELFPYQINYVIGGGICDRLAVNQSTCVFTCFFEIP